jgi:4-hydroxy-2-oxoheptanedioate aldolase
MFSKPNKLRTKLETGVPVLGTVMYTWSPVVMELAGLAGMDFVRIDNEHAWRQDSSAEQLMRAAHLMDVVPIMRVDRENPYLIRKALEIGAGGVLVPDVQDAKETEAIVKASKFPPYGTRGYSGQNWSGGWGCRAGKAWVEWSNTQPMIGVMIENTHAVQNIDSILQVEGLDFILFGPADYSMSLGLGSPQKDHPQVQEGILKTIEAAKKAGIPAALGVGQNLDEIKKYKDMGYNILELGSDLAVIRTGWEKLRVGVENMG